MHHADCKLKSAYADILSAVMLIPDGSKHILSTLLRPLLKQLIAAALVQADKALSELPAAAGDVTQLAKASKKTRKAKSSDAAPESAAADVKLGESSGKARPTTAKTTVDSGREPEHDASQLAKPSQKVPSARANSSRTSPPEQGDAAAKLPKPLKETTVKKSSRKTASKAAASAASPEVSSLSDFPAGSSKGSVTSTAGPGGIPAQAKKQSQSQTEQTAVLASQAADTTLSADSDRAQSSNEADAELSPAKEKRRSKRQATVSRSNSKGTGQGAPVRLVLPSYQQLKAQMPADGQILPVAPSNQKAIKDHMRAFRGSAYVQDQALALYVNSQVLLLVA